MKRLLILAIATLAINFPAQAHEVRPGYLLLSQSGDESYNVLWKVPARGEMKLSLRVQLPDNCDSLTPVASSSVGGSYIDRWSVRCPGGLVGRAIFIDGLSSTLTDTLVRIERLDGSTQVGRVRPDEPSMLVVATPGWRQVSATYLGLGVEHILLGIDHLLFVFALMLLVEGWRKLVATITAFTVAHSLTLAAATLGFVNISQRPIEAVIALSIVFLAAELLRANKGEMSLAQSWPWAIAFTFGLLHGLGFAGALNEIGLPEQSIPLALLFFNIGVELGQLLFIAAVLVAGAIIRRVVRTPPNLAPQLSAYAIGAIAAFWTIERVAGL